MDAVISCNILVQTVWSPSLQIDDQIVKPIKGNFQTLAGQQVFLLKVHCVFFYFILFIYFFFLTEEKELYWPTNLKGQHNLYCLTYICGGPRHLSSFKQCSEDLIFL